MTEPENDSISVDDLLAALSSDAPESTSIDFSGMGSRISEEVADVDSRSDDDSEEDIDDADGRDGIDLLAALGIAAPEPKLDEPAVPKAPKTSAVQRARMREAAKQEKHIRSRQWQEEMQRKEEERIRLAGQQPASDEEIFDRAAAAYRRVAVPDKVIASDSTSTSDTGTFTSETPSPAVDVQSPQQFPAARPFQMQGFAQPLRSLQPIAAQSEQSPNSQIRDDSQGQDDNRVQPQENALTQPQTQALRPFTHAPMSDFGFSRRVVTGSAPEAEDSAPIPTSATFEGSVPLPEMIERRSFFGSASAQNAPSIQRLGVLQESTEQLEVLQGDREGVGAAPSTEPSLAQPGFPSPFVAPVPSMGGNAFGGEEGIEPEGASGGAFTPPFANDAVGQGGPISSQPDAALPGQMPAPSPGAPPVAPVFQPVAPMPAAPNTNAPSPNVPFAPQQSMPMEPVGDQKVQTVPGIAPAPQFRSAPIPDTSAFFEGRGVFRDRRAVQDTSEDEAGSKRNNILGIILIIVAVLCAVMAIGLLSGVFNTGSASSHTSASSSSSVATPSSSNNSGSASVAQSADDAASTVVYSYVIRGVDGSTHEARETATFDSAGILGESTIEVQVQSQEVADQLAEQLRSEFGASVKQVDATPTNVVIVLDIGRDDLNKEAYTELLAANMMEFSVVE